ncbi:MAG: hypothetical protein Q4C95_02235 [Planctomycetia bacterium]|nr:hypothetical protein [Planctomycetia bacterium]
MKAKLAVIAETYKKEVQITCWERRTSRPGTGFCDVFRTVFIEKTGF